MVAVWWKTQWEGDLIALKRDLSSVDEWWITKILSTNSNCGIHLPRCPSLHAQTWLETKSSCNRTMTNALRYMNRKWFGSQMFHGRTSRAYFIFPGQKLNDFVYSDVYSCILFNVHAFVHSKSVNIIQKSRTVKFWLVRSEVYTVFRYCVVWKAFSSEVWFWLSLVGL